MQDSRGDSRPFGKLRASSRLSAGQSPAVPRVRALARYNVAVPFIIRDFQLKDFEPLWRIDQECFPPGISYSRTELRACIRHPGAFTLLALAEKTSEIAGFIVANTGSTGHIVTIDVVAADRRSGIGSQLLGAAEDRLRASGSRALSLETAVDNLSALAFYKRHGFSVVKTLPRYYSNGVDALVMRKDLTPPGEPAGQS